jgi:hypothetical protein
MSLTNRLTKIESYIEMNENLYPKPPDFDKMTDEELEDFLVRCINNILQEMKYPCAYHSVDLSTSEGFKKGLKLYRDNYCNDKGREHYLDGHIELLGKLFEKHRDKIHTKSLI